jgi:peptide/nickel transport system permease protein
MALMLILLVAVAGALVLRSPQSFAQQDRLAVAAPASSLHWAGTDELGRDRAVRISFALLLGLTGAGAASALAGSLALGLGALAGIAPVWLSRALLYGADLFLTLPWIFLLMLVRSVLPLTLSPLRSGCVTFLLLALLGAPIFLRMNYEKMKTLLRAEWLLQAHASGLRNSQLIRQVLPHLRPLLLSQFLLYVPACVVAEANLGQMGLGVTEPVPSWGTLVAGLQSASLNSTSHLIYLPVLMLVLVLTILELLLQGVQQ